MASNSESSSYPKRLILKISSSSCSLVLPRTPSHSPSPSTPPPHVETMKFPTNLLSSSSLNPRLEVLYDQVFSEIPHISPHVNPLATFGSENIKQGIRLGCDIAFVKLVTKLHNLDDPISFLVEVESFTQEIEEFEQVGYDVTEIRERLNLLKIRAQDEKDLQDKVEKFEEEKKEKQEKLEEDEIVLVELAAQSARVENEIKEQRFKIESIELKKKKIMEISKLNAVKFKNLAHSLW